MNSTQHKFEVGQRVEMTVLALRQRLQGSKDRRTGVIHRIQPDSGIMYLIIKRDDEPRFHTYHPSFWQPASTEAIVERTCPTCGHRLP